MRIIAATLAVTSVSLATAIMLSMGLPLVQAEQQAGSRDRSAQPIILPTPPPISGFLFVVTSTGDGDNTGAGAACDDGTGNCTLRAAIEAANNTSGTDDTIEFSIPTTDPGFNAQTGAWTINLGTALPDLSSNIKIVGLGPDKLTVRRSSTSKFRIFNVVAATTVSFSGMTMASGAAPGDSNGGGIQNAGTLSLTNCVLDHNQGDTQGFGQTGGIFNTGTLNVINSTISGNIASVSGGILNAGTATISDSNVSGNSGGSAGGGVWNDATLTITNSAISGNSAGEGGGIFNALSGSLSVLNSTLSANLAGGGGGIWNSSSGAVAVINSTLSGNSASSASTNNGNGGGILNSGSQVIISNSTISGNSTTLSGGGIYNGPAAAVSIISSIVALNTAANSGPDVGGSFTSNGFNLIAETDGSTGFTQATDHTGTMASPLDPKLDPAGLQNNGGPTQTIALKSGSIAIDSANPGSVPRDQRGYLRNGAPDIGAFEFGGTIPVSLGNISTRSFVNTGDNVMIGGFIIAGPGNKLVLLRAIGPSLSNPPVSLANTLQDPTISLFNSGGAKIISNDNWADASNAQSIDPALRPSNGLESAILISLAPGAYTAIVSGVNGGTGIGLVEVFDLDSTAASKLINISTRGLVETGDSVMIGGFIIKGPDSDKVVVRAIGPSLASPPFSLTNVLQNPTLSLFDVNGMVFASNDDWRGTQEADIIATGLQPTNDAESAIVTTLVPGNYTAIVRGVGGTTGVALVEVYGLN